MGTMLSSYPVVCPHAECGWAGNLIPSHDRGGGDAEAAPKERVWFHCPRCGSDWQAQVSGDRVVGLIAGRPSAD
jgi:hypothetical protein